MKLHLELDFKGARTYIQGPDMLNAAIATTSHQINITKFKQFNFIIHRMTSHNLSLRLVQGKQPLVDDQMPVATLSFEARDLYWQATLIEEPGEPPCRFPYDEDSIIALCSTNHIERSIRLESAPAFTPIEVIVAMTKALHQTLYPDAPGKWVFCRWESQCWPITSTLNGLTIILSKTLGSRLTKSAVVSNGERIGWVYFSSKVSP